MYPRIATTLAGLLVALNEISRTMKRATLRGRHRCVWVLPIFVTVSCPVGLAQTSPITAERACTLLMKRMAVHDGVPAGRETKTWFCDITRDENNQHPDWWLIGLRSSRKCEGICSNLRGWFAVNRKTAEIREWDMAEYVVGGPIGKP